VLHCSLLHNPSNYSRYVRPSHDPKQFIVLCCVQERSTLQLVVDGSGKHLCCSSACLHYSRYARNHFVLNSY
jgi:hypothetical protein